MVMTATPIPRTLVLTDYGDMDISIIHSKPENRPEIKTISVSIPRMNEVVKAISRAIKNEEQIFWVCPLVKDSEKLDLAAAETRQQYLNKIFPNKVTVGGGNIGENLSKLIEQDEQEINLKILDINKHENLIKIANQHSKLIINKNPNLIGEEGEKIKNLLYLFGQDKAVKLIKSG